MLKSILHGGICMKINTKRKFITLLVSVMAKKGYMIETFDFEKDLITFLSFDKYSNLFYFFENISDFDFEDILKELQRDGLVSVSFDTRKTRIELLHKMFYSVSDEILSSFDDESINLMEELLEEHSLSVSLNSELPNNVQGIYRLTNPNRVYNLNNFHSIITDGVVCNVDTNKTGAYLVQDAIFVFLQSFMDCGLVEMQVFHKFEDRRYIYNKAKEILKFYYYLEMTAKKRASFDEEEFENFEKLDEVNGYRYKK